MPMANAGFKLVEFKNTFDYEAPDQIRTVLVAPSQVVAVWVDGPENNYMTGEPGWYRVYLRLAGRLDWSYFGKDGKEYAEDFLRRCQEAG